MKSSEKLLKLILSLLVFPVLAGAATAGASLTGIIRDQHGDVIEGATVEARQLASGAVSYSKTDAAGKYEFKELNPGEYRISVSRAGFSAAVKSAAVQAGGGTARLDFLLVPGTIENIVTVTAGKGTGRAAAELPQAITVTNVTAIEERRPASVTQILEETPNLTLIGANPLAARPRLRGLASNRLLMIVDGERLNNVRSDPASGISPAIVDVMQLESIEVLSGSGSSVYGSDAIAGTINLISRQPITVTEGRYLGFRLDGDLRSNGFFRRTAATLNFSTARLAIRSGGSLFRLDSYHTGGQAIPLAEVARIGNFASAMSNAVSTNLARSFAVWELPAGGEISNGQAHGFYSQQDAWLFAAPKQSIRYRQLNNRQKNIGFAFLAAPFDVRSQSNRFRRLDKYGLRYEGYELKSRLAHLAIGAYRQKYTFPDDVLNYAINPGSSWAMPAGQAFPALTGNASVLTPANFTDGKSAVTSYGADAQATFVPFKNGRLTTGIGYLRDASADSFSRFDRSPTAAPTTAIIGRASTPDAVYRNLSWSNLLEYDALRFLRLSGGIRVDNWRTEAKVTTGFPLSTESAILNASFNALRATPGGVDVPGAEGILKIVGGQSGIKTSRTSVTGNAGIVLRLPGAVNPYFRWENSYREPGITERYILRDFGDKTFSLLLLPNTALKPEKASIYEIGVKIQQARWRLAAGYFRNNLRDFIGNRFSPTLFVAADPQKGIDPLSPFFPFHGVLYVQRANTARARIQGIESNFEASFSLKGAGSLTPFGTLGALKGTNLTPDLQTLTLIRNFYNRADTPLPLKGSASDVPLTGISPLNGIFGARYSDSQGKLTAEYKARYAGRITRADPLDLTTAMSTQYGSFASLRASLTQSVRAGYTVRHEKYRLLLAAGVDNLTNRLYFDAFQIAPAPGRSFVFGLTVEGFDLLRR